MSGRETPPVSVLIFIILLLVSMTGWLTMIGLGIMGISVAYWEGMVLGIIARLVVGSSFPSRVKE